MLIFPFTILIFQLISEIHTSPECPGMNKATLQINFLHESYQNVNLFFQFKSCHNCSKQLLLARPINKSYVLLDSNYDYDFMVNVETTNGETLKVCEDFKHVKLAECGHYTLDLDVASKLCKISTLKESIDSIKYLYIAGILLVFVLILMNQFGKQLPNTDGRRICSLDAFRGFSVFWMVFFNYGSGGYKFLQHADWNGLTPADLVFPWFLWILGFSIPISTKWLIESKNLPRLQVLEHIIRRSAKLFITGLVVCSVIGPGQYNLSRIRIPGVLQRISICYLSVATLELIFYRKRQNLISAIWKQLLVILVLSSIWIYFTLYWTTSNCPLGYMGPGGLHHFGNYANCTGGIAGHVDNLIFGTNHLYPRGSIKKVYKSSMNFDPEGILGTLNAIALTCLGTLSGKMTLLYNEKRRHMFIWLFSALVLFVLFYSMTGLRLEHERFPVNKNLWTVTFNVLMGSGSLVCMVGFYYVIDVRHWWSGRPFIGLGLNSVLIYILHYLFGGRFPVHWRGVPERHSWHLGMNLWGAVFWTLIAIALDYKNIYLSF